MTLQVRRKAASVIVVGNDAVATRGGVEDLCVDVR
jgi:hypothetical protein